ASGEISGKGSATAFTSAGTVRGTFAPVGAFAVRYQLAREGKSGEVWRFEQSEVTFPGTPTRITASGHYATGTGSAAASQQLTAQADLTWHALAWPPRG